jgi:rSAM/selenodomain-associated transferase 1
LNPNSPSHSPINLGVMAKAPIAGHCKTRLGSVIGMEQAASLYGAMLRDCMSRLEATGAFSGLSLVAAPENDGVDVLSEYLRPHWSLVPQRGKNLGRRMANAIDELGQSGCPVIITGSDSPTMPVQSVQDGICALAQPNRVLLGPSTDGGYYLIGLSTPNDRLFEDIPWSSTDVYAATVERCRTLDLKITELPRWYDVDDADGLSHLTDDLNQAPGLAPATAAWLTTHGLFDRTAPV